MELEKIKNQVYFLKIAQQMNKRKGFREIMNISYSSAPIYQTLSYKAYHTYVISDKGYQRNEELSKKLLFTKIKTAQPHTPAPLFNVCLSSEGVVFACGSRLRAPGPRLSHVGHWPRDPRRRWGHWRWGLGTREFLSFNSHRYSITLHAVSIRFLHFIPYTLTRYAYNAKAISDATLATQAQWSTRITGKR